MREGDPQMTLNEANVFANLKKWWASVLADPAVANSISTAPSIATKRPTLKIKQIVSERMYFDLYCKVVCRIDPVKTGSDNCETLVVTDFTANQTFD